MGTARFQPALREAPPRCSWARWAVGEAGASAWLSLPRLCSLRKFGMGRTYIPLRCRIPCGPHPTFCRVLSPLSSLCFPSGPPNTTTQHSARAPRVALPHGHFEAFSPGARRANLTPAAPGSHGHGYTRNQLGLEETHGHLRQLHFLSRERQHQSSSPSCPTRITHLGAGGGGPEQQVEQPEYSVSDLLMGLREFRSRYSVWQVRRLLSFRRREIQLRT